MAQDTEPVLTQERAACPLPCPTVSTNCGAATTSVGVPSFFGSAGRAFPSGYSGPALRADVWRTRRQRVSPRCPSCPSVSALGADVQPDNGASGYLALHRVQLPAVELRVDHIDGMYRVCGFDIDFEDLASRSGDQHVVSPAREHLTTPIVN